MTDGAGRLFFGVRLPERARDRIAEALDSLPPGIAGRLAPRENWHITLRFLGETSTAQLERIRDAIAALALPTPFELRISGWGAFPRPASARVLWAGVADPTRSLERIASQLETLARGAGFEPEERPFRAHVTVARFREPIDLRPQLAGLKPIDLGIPAESFTLFRSHLGKGPPRYDPVATFALGG